jgi:hypothetical protein
MADAPAPSSSMHPAPSSSMQPAPSSVSLAPSSEKKNNFIFYFFKYKWGYNFIVGDHGLTDTNKEWRCTSIIISISKHPKYMRLSLSFISRFTCINI